MAHLYKPARGQPIRETQPALRNPSCFRSGRLFRAWLTPRSSLCKAFCGKPAPRAASDPRSCQPSRGEHRSRPWKRRRRPELPGRPASLRATSHTVLPTSRQLPLKTRRLRVSARAPSRDIPCQHLPKIHRPALLAATIATILVAFFTLRPLTPVSSSCRVFSNQSARRAPQHCGQCRSVHELYTLQRE